MVEHYRTRFQPSHLNPEPRASIGVSVVCAPSHEEAEYLSWSRWGSRMMQGRGQRPGIPTPEEAMAFPYTEPELDYIAHMRRRSIYGSPGEVRDRLLELGLEFGVDEFMVVTIAHDFAARVRSYELIAREFGLNPASPAEGEG